MYKSILILALFFPILSYCQETSYVDDNYYFVDKSGDLHKGVGHKYEYMEIMKLRGDDYFTVKELWVEKAFSFFANYFFDGDGNKFFYNMNENKSTEDYTVFNIKSGDFLLLMSNRELWYYTDIEDGKMPKTLVKFTKVSKSRWID